MQVSVNYLSRVIMKKKSFKQPFVELVLFQFLHHIWTVQRIKVPSWKQKIVGFLWRVNQSRCDKLDRVLSVVQYPPLVARPCLLFFCSKVVDSNLEHNWFASLYSKQKRNIAIPLINVRKYRTISNWTVHLNINHISQCFYHFTKSVFSAIQVMSNCVFFISDKKMYFHIGLESSHV